MNDNSNVALISYIVSDDMLQKLTDLDPSPAIQTQRFALVLIRLLQKSANSVGSYNFVPIQDFPVGRRIWFGYQSHDRNGHRIKSLPFVNLVALKHITRFFSLLLRYNEIRRFNTIVVHGLHLPNLIAALLLKSSGARIGVVLTDRQGVILPSDGRIRRWLKAVDQSLSIFLARRFDFGIALSHALAHTYVPHRPVVLLPGIFDEELERRVTARARVRQDDIFRVVYFGGLTAEYGVAALLNAMPLLDSRVQIRLFGRGALESAIATAATSQLNLYWGGLVDQDRLVQEMADCDLLINPRPAQGELAEMSSPSKLIEYAASGRPVMTTRLPSLTPDLMQWVLPIDSEKPSGLAEVINAASKMDSKKLEELGVNFQAEIKKKCSIDGLAARLASLMQHVGTLS